MNHKKRTCTFPLRVETKALPLYSGSLFSTSCSNLVLASQLWVICLLAYLFFKSTFILLTVSWNEAQLRLLAGAQFTPELPRDHSVHDTDMKRSGTSRIFVWIIRDPKGERTRLNFTPGNFPLDYNQKRHSLYYWQEFRKLFVNGKQPGVWAFNKQQKVAL